jgi:hypothetical protein
MASAPKSNAVYMAYKAARRAAKETGSLAPPAHILNAPTKLMKTLGYGDGYAYDHDVEGGVSGQNYFPDGMARPRFYEPKPASARRPRCASAGWFALGQDPAGREVIPSPLAGEGGAQRRMRGCAAPPLRSLCGHA